MANYTLIGFGPAVYDFDKRENGELKHIHSDGYNLFLAQPRPRIEGMYCERVFLSYEKLNGVEKTLAVGDEVELCYNAWRKPIAVRVITPVEQE